MGTLTALSAVGLIGCASTTYETANITSRPAAANRATEDAANIQNRLRLLRQGMSRNAAEKAIRPFERSGGSKSCGTTSEIYWVNSTTALCLEFSLKNSVKESSDDALLSVSKSINQHPTKDFSNWERIPLSVSYSEKDRKIWLQVAADINRDPNRRRWYVRYLFEQMAIQGISLGNLLRSLDAPVNWISAKKIQKLPPVLAGALPLGLSTLETQSIFFIPILSDQPGTYRLAFYMALAGDPSETELQDAFMKGAATNSVGNIRIVAVAKLDSDYMEKRYPGIGPRITW